MTTFAIIETGGKQYLVEEGKSIVVEKLAGGPKKEGEGITFDKVLATGDGDALTLGAPYLEGASIGATLVEAGKGKKVLVVKYKAKSRYLKRRGHRQPYAKVKIGKIS